MLQLPQAGRVRRADVHHQVVRERREHLDAAYVVDDRLIERCLPILSDVHPHWPWTPSQPGEASSNLASAIVVESHPVDEGLVLREAEEPGPGISGLRSRGDRPYLD